MASTAKSAVSDYEHLNHRPTSGHVIGLNESEDDELFLKAPSPKAFVDAYTSLFNQNNNNLSNFTKSKDFLESVSNVPVPFSWSPGMTLESNPNLAITPEKPGKSAGVHGNVRDNVRVLDTDNMKHKQAPRPVPWSPGMRPEKSIFITPDKMGPTHVDSKNNAKNRKSGFNQLNSPTGETKDTLKSYKERQSVRFDLPSNSSGEDTFFDEDSALLSPVTIKGKDLSPSPSGTYSESASPEYSWKAYDTKSYNPNMYSDDSMMDESISFSKQDTFSQPFIQSGEPQPQVTGVSLSTSVNLVDKLKELIQDSNYSNPNLEGEDDPIIGLATNSSTLQCSIPKDKYTNRSTKTSQPGSRAPSWENKQNCPSNVHLTEQPNKSSKSQTKKTNKSRSREEQVGPQLKDSVPPYYPPSSGSCIVKEPHHQPDIQTYSYPFQDSGNDNNDIEHAFARPEFNSTLKFRQELDELCDQEIDIVKAFNEKLKLSGDKRAEIQEKAASLTNVPTDQFTNLIDLDLPVDRVCDRIVKMRTNKVVKKKKIQPDKTTSTNVPDLMEFYSPDLQKEMPGFSLQGVNPVSVNLISASNELAFDVYRHNRVWEGLLDF